MTVNVNTSARFQTVSGFGATAVPFENDRFYNSHVSTVPPVVSATPAKRQALAKLIFEDLGMSRARLPYRGIEPTNDNGDAEAFDWTKFVFDYRPTQDAIGSLATGPDHTAALVKDSIPFGLTTFFPVNSVEWEPDWMHAAAGSPRVAPGMEAEFAEFIAAAAKRYADLGVEVPYLSIANEPSFATGLGASLTPAQLVDVVKYAGRRFRALGFSTKLVAPDDFSPANALPYVRALLADTEARGYLGAIAYHSYDAYVSTRDMLATSGMGAPPAGPIAARQEIRDLAATWGLPVWMTESSGSVDGLGRFKSALARVNHVHDELVYANVAAFDQMSHWFLDRPDYEEALATVSFDASGALATYAALPIGTAMSQYARYVRPGSVRVAATSTNARVRASAFVAPGNRLVVVIINNWSTGISLSLSAPGTLLGGVGERIVTTEQISRASTNFAVSSGSNDFCVPPESITTIVTPLL